jgi:hypothetical protein
MAGAFSLHRAAIGQRRPRRFMMSRKLLVCLALLALSTLPGCVAYPAYGPGYYGAPRYYGGYYNRPNYYRGGYGYRY